MKKIAIILLSVIALTLIVSCNTNHGVAMAQNKGVVGKNNIPRPDWVLQDQSNAITHYVSGYGTGKTFEVAKMKAQLAADSNLALWVTTSVESVRDRYLENTIVDESEQYIDKFVLTATEAGKAVLSGVTEIDFWEDLEGGVWVLRSIKVSHVKAQIKAAIETTCADSTLFKADTDVSAVLGKLEKALDEYFPE